MDAVVKYQLSDGREINLCLRCSLVVDALGNPDPAYYSPETIARPFTIDNQRCTHSKGGIGIQAEEVPVPTLFEEFENEFRPLLGKTPRWKAFEFIAKELLSKERPVIIETGTLRQPGNWAGDGQSTALWDWIVAKTGGTAISTDINFYNCEVAAKTCPNVRVNCGDSVAFLRGYLPANINLLYLDAFDYAPGAELSSMMHHAAELAAAWDQLPSGCLIAVDDCHSDSNGKHAMVRHILSGIGVQPEVTGYITVWRRP